MTAGPSLVASREFVSLLDSFRLELDSLRAESVAGTYSKEELLTCWSKLCSAGWLEVAAPRDSGGRALPFAAVVELAEVWGEYLVPLPFISTVLARRWLGVNVPSDASLLLAVDSGDLTGGGLMAFGEFRQRARFVRRLGVGGGELEDIHIDFHPTGVDTYAQSLPICEVDFSTDLDAQCLAEYRALLAGEGVGAAAAALAQAAEYTQARVQFGQPIATFQAVRHRLANMHLSLELARSAARWAYSDVVNARSAAAYAIASAQAVVEDAIQVHGAIGFTWDRGLHFYLRHLLALHRLAAH